MSMTKTTKTKAKTSKSIPETAADVFDNLDGQLMMMSAFRYCCGRQTYVVGSCIDYLSRWWKYATDNTKHVILRDIVEALMDGNCGSPTIDRPAWKGFAESKIMQLPIISRIGIKQATNWKDKEWPLSLDTGDSEHETMPVIAVDNVKG
jgi:hypothetical protein